MIPIAIPVLGPEEAEAASAAILSCWVSQGPEVAAFEADFGARVGAPYACAVSNCTTALHLALLALGVGDGDEVITVSHSFVATANAIRQCGARPVFVDIEEDGFNIDPAAAAEAITSRTKAILCVHQMGMPCNLPALLNLANVAGVPVVEDAACAIGSEIHLEGHWQPIGRPLGAIACFSFHPRKILTTGEGGMLTTGRSDWDKSFRLRRQHGMSVPDTQRHASQRVVFEDYLERGFNYRLTDPQAAVGRVQLERLDAILVRRRELAARYREMLSGIVGIRPPSEPDWARSNWQSYCVGLDPAIDQRALMQALLDRGIASRRGIMCAHMEPAHSDIPERHSLARSEKARDHSIIVPLYPAMSDDDQVQVVEALADAVARQKRAFI
jgi:dTDP-4-amino-4,6-dideoxygalactose transaminase